MTQVIRRKIDRARQPAAEGAPGADRGWRLAFGRASRDMMGLSVEFRRLRVLRLSLGEVMEFIPDRSLVSMLDGPQGTLGVLFMAPGVTSAVIEMQTLGRLSRHTPPARRPTRIDAAMVAGLIDRALSGLDDTLAEEADRTWASGFRYASFLDDARPLHLLLEDEPLRVLVADLTLGDAAEREGQVILALPAAGRAEAPKDASIGSEHERPLFTAALAEHVMQVESRLEAVIGRLSLPLAQIMALEAGQMLALGSAALDSVTVEAADGRRLARARLGQNRGMRAVKLVETDLGMDRQEGAIRLRDNAHAPDTSLLSDPLRATG